MKTTRISERSMITPWQLLGRNKGSVSGFLKQDGVKFYSLHTSGRAALFEGLKILGCTSDDKALLPAYICETATYPFHKLGIQIGFYNTLPSLEPDIADIASKVDRKTKAVMVVDYFGFPQELGQVREFCKEHGLFLIEDNSHGFLSKNGSRLLGTFGDIGFSSIYKNLATPDGGILFVNNDELIPDNTASLASRGFSLKSDGLFFLSSVLRFMETKYSLPTWILRDIYRKVHPVEEGTSHETFFLGMPLSRATIAGMEKLDIEEIIRKRRSNYNCWLEKMSDVKGVKVPFKSLLEGISPWTFPLIAEEGNFIEEIRSQGIGCSTWPLLPPEVKGQKDYTNYLAEHLFTLPAHQYVNQKYLK
jgi:dTDP-4-amino-4,6-dideoxygalactose transaminase